MNSKRVDLLSNAAAGNGTEQRWPGGKGSFFGEGTFGGGLIKIQAKSPNGTWVDIAGATMSAASVVDFACGPGLIRGVCTTGSAFFAYAIKYGA